MDNETVLRRTDRADGLELFVKWGDVKHRFSMPEIKALQQGQQVRMTFAVYELFVQKSTD